MKILFILFFLGLEVSRPATEALWVDCSIRIRDEDTRKWLEDIPVEIYAGGVRTKRLISARDGKVWLNLETDKQYEIRLNSGEGKQPFISKLIKFDLTQIDLNSWKYKKSTTMKYQYELEILLFRPEVCENFNFLKEEPVIHYVYSPERKDLSDIADRGISKKIRQMRKKRCNSSEKAIF